MSPLLAALLSGPAVVLAAAPAQHPVAQLDQILNRFLQKQDAESAGAFLLDDFVLTFNVDPPVDRTAFLAGIKSPQVVMTLNESSGVQVHTHGDTAVLTGELHQKGTIKGSPFDLRMKVSYTWVRVGDTWKVLAGHLTPIQEPAQTTPVPLPKKR